jgi:membrane protein implicated in regulation of membrane protease activity
MPVGVWVNWLLVIGGLICVIIELALGALTGLDLALVGGSLTIGGAIGLLAGSARIGLLAGGVLALLYLAILRSWLKSKLTVRNIASNVDAVVGKTGVVTKRIAPSEPGMVKVGAEVWRAELAGAEDAARDLGAQITVQSVEGVTLKVR